MAMQQRLSLGAYMFPWDLHLHHLTFSYASSANIGKHSGILPCAEDQRSGGGNPHIDAHPHFLLHAYKAP
jgi:hypothetical protein